MMLAGVGYTQADLDYFRLSDVKLWQPVSKAIEEFLIAHDGETMDELYNNAALFMPDSEQQRQSKQPQPKRHKLKRFYDVDITELAIQNAIGYARGRFGDEAGLYLCESEIDQTAAFMTQPEADAWAGQFPVNAAGQPTAWWLSWEDVISDFNEITRHKGEPSIANTYYGLIL